MNRRINAVIGSLFFLHSAAYSQDEPEPEKLEVKGQRIQKKDAEEMSKIEISSEEASLVAPGGDIAQVPKLFPGTISRPRDSEVSIRGSDGRDSLYFIDDLQAPNIFEPISGTSVIPNRAISTLSFFPGNFDSQFGNSTAGVIKLETRDTEIIDPYTEIRVNLPIYSSIYHEDEAGEDGSMILSFRKSTLEPFVKAVFQEEGQVLVPYFQDAYFQYYYAEDAFSLKTRFLHSRSGAEVKVYNDRSTSADGSVQFNFDNGYDLLGFDVETSIAGHNFEISPYITDSETKFSVGKIFFEIESLSYTLPIRTILRPSKNITVFVGLEMTYTDFELNALVPDSTRDGTFSDPENAERIALAVNSIQRTDAGFAAFEFKEGSLTLTPSFRLFNQTNIKKSGLDPRFSMRYELAATNAFKLGIGQYSASPPPEELDPVYGNPEVTWIKSNHYSVGWETVVFDSWTSDFQFFYKVWDNLTGTDPKTRFNNKTKRKAQGMEWFLRYGDGDGIFGWLSYTYSVAKEKRGEDQIEVFTDNDSTHILHLVGNYKLTDNFQVGGRFKFQTGYAYTPVDEVWYQTNTDTYQPIENPNLVNTERVPDTISASIFGEYESKFDEWSLITRIGLEEYQFQESSPNFEYNFDYTKKEFTSGVMVIPFIEWRAIL